LSSYAAAHGYNLGARCTAPIRHARTSGSHLFVALLISAAAARCVTLNGVCHRLLAACFAYQRLEEMAPSMGRLALIDYLNLQADPFCKPLAHRHDVAVIVCLHHTE